MSLSSNGKILFELHSCQILIIKEGCLKTTDPTNCLEMIRWLFGNRMGVWRTLNCKSTRNQTPRRLNRILNEQPRKGRGSPQQRCARRPQPRASSNRPEWGPSAVSIPKPSIDIHDSEGQLNQTGHGGSHIPPVLRMRLCLPEFHFMPPRLFSTKKTSRGEPQGSIVRNWLTHFWGLHLNATRHSSQWRWK